MWVASKNYAIPLTRAILSAFEMSFIIKRYTNLRLYLCSSSIGRTMSVCGALQGGVLEKKLCEAMVCWIPKKKICYTQAEQRAYPGTKCGNRKWCMKGKCISDPRAPSGKGMTTTTTIVIVMIVVVFVIVMFERVQNSP